MEHNGRIAYETIVAAKNGDTEAICEILRGISAISPNGRYTMPTAIPIALLMTTAGSRLKRNT